MKQIIEVLGKTVEAAIADGAAQLGIERELVTYEILEMPKKGFLGFGEVPAKVRVTYNPESENTALAFVNTIIEDMEIDAKAEMTDLPNGKLIRITGPGSGILIGHHGATLDALQYLVNLAANKKDGSNDTDVTERPEEERIEEEEYNNGLKTQITERGRTVEKGYMRITVDVENYREKREETLRELARRMASKVLKYKKSITLEPMNPYERRIIHSEVQGLSGVTTTSVGTDNERKIVIYYENGDGSTRTRNSRNRYKDPKNTSEEARPEGEAPAENAIPSDSYEADNKSSEDGVLNSENIK